MKKQSTYSLLVSSQEKGRSLFEGAVYALVVLSTVASVFQFASQSVIVPRVEIAGAKAQATLVADVKPAVAVPVRG